MNGPASAIRHPVCDAALARLAVFVVRVYRRWLSPLKGYTCAHNHVHRQGTCSGYGLRVFSEHGFSEAKNLMVQRFQECGAAARSISLSSETDEPSKREEKKKQSSFGRDCVAEPLGNCAGEGACGSLGRCKGAAAETGGRSGCAKLGAIGECGGGIGDCTP